ncbi:HpcH/HpaI aldolase family protein [Rhodovulum strictum]|uniref:Hydroxypyruvate/pyruvate aldolase n=1 Tax=Rhodovulum strictum TaxID=58314 RepID=A0A844BGF2_9RHOB|nr:HpcH/HpaI aldolase/citrate lyase family protein [Rhodovulum strictum]MRH20053.1 4-hydroxy-2-oxo-heptane-1,7-dioate aldolase [Rhodovulum strictum]
MDNPTNLFKSALRAGRPQIGIWNAIPQPMIAELLAGCGFDWVLVDTEHAPMEVRDVLPALQAVAAQLGSSAVVRVAINDWVLIKRHLDQGAQSLMVPYVQSRAEAEAAVRAMRYPPRGVRGVAGITRASRFGLIADYIARAEQELCLIVQVETRAGLERLEDIATVEGVDGVFIGPADLAASLGFPGQSGHPEVVAAIEGAIARLKAVGVPSGILSTDPVLSRRWMELGTAFTALGIDIALLARAATALRAEVACG